jgi:hypothetical protein
VTRTDISEAAVVGEQGLVQMRYTGYTDIDSFEGEVTGQAYLFGLFRQRAYVDARDTTGLLSTQEDGQFVFQEVR